MKKAKPYVISVLIALAVGGLSALLTKGGTGLFDEIVKPPLTPPPVVFPIVWSVLFFLMGISAARIWLKRKEDRPAASNALTVYGSNLVINFLWSIIFFNFRQFLFAFLWLILLWVVILRMILAFKKLDKPAAYLQLPYLIWVTFAGYLTFAIWILNR